MSIFTVSTVWNTRETGDMNGEAKQSFKFPVLVYGQKVVKKKAKLSGCFKSQIERESEYLASSIFLLSIIQVMIKYGTK